MNGNSSTSQLRQRATAHVPKTTCDDATDTSASLSARNVNPFVHKISLTTYDKIKFYTLTVLLLPIRVIMMCICVLGAYLFARIGTFGVSQEELRHKPMKGWRRYSKYSFFNHRFFITGCMKKCVML